MKKMIFLLLTFLIAGLQLVQAQGITISGKTTEQSTGEALPGVTIMVKGTTVGAVSLMDGTYSLNVPGSGSTLVFSFIGYKQQEIAVGSRSVIDVALQEDVSLLDEVVVTGYSIEKKKDIIGSVSIVNTTEMLSTPAGNVTSQMQGRVSGLTISSDGSLGGSSKVRVRGFGSFGDSDPLYIIDGVPGSVDRLNPNDIESMQVLKDAASSAVYGARAANGVIIITTKQGKPGEAKFTIDSYSGLNFFPESKFPDMLNAQEWGDAYWLGMLGAGRTPGSSNWSHPQYGTGATAVVPEYILVNNNGTKIGGAEIERLKVSDPAAYAALVDPSKYSISNYQIVKAADTDWFDEAYNPAPITSLQATASGGSSSGTYVVGIGYLDQKSISDEYSYYKRYTLRANTTLNVKSFLKFGENLQFSFNEGRSVGSNDAIWTMQAIMPVWDEGGNPAGSAAPGVVAVGTSGRNPIGEAWRNRFDGNYTYAVFGNVFADLTPIKDLVIHSSFGIDYSSTTTKNVTPKTYEHYENTTTNSIAWTMNNGNAWTLTNTATYSKVFGDHSLKLMLGSESYKNYSINVNANRQLIPVEDDPNFLYIDIATGTQTNTGNNSRNMLYSLFGRLDYTLADKYMVNFTLRRDGSSKFGINNRYGYFPSVALGYRLSNEEFMKSITWLTDLKVRASYGIIGNQNGLSNENQYTTIQRLNNYSYSMAGTNNTVSQSYMIIRQGNPDAKWEKSGSLNLGFDASLFKGATLVSFDYFIKNTVDLLVTNQPPYTGLNVTQPSVNVGNVQNKGVELNITQRGTIAKTVDFDVTLNFSAYKNLVQKVMDNPAAVLYGGNTRLGSVTITKAGYPMSQFYGYQLDGFYNSQEEVNEYNASYVNGIIPAAIGRWRIKDVSGPNGVPDNVINDYDRTIIGSPHPDFQLGLNLSLAYKGIDLTGFLFWSQGGDLFNFNKYNTDFQTFQYNRSSRFLYDSWTPEKGNSALLPKLDIDDTYSNKYANSYYVEDATYLRLKNLQLGYTLPDKLVKRIGLDKLRVYVQTQNLFTLSKSNVLDPGISISGADLGMGVVSSATPTPQQMLIGLNLGF